MSISDLKFTWIFWGIRQLKNSKNTNISPIWKNNLRKKNVAADLQSRQGTAGKQKIRRNSKN
jgi:hypothetical protein